MKDYLVINKDEELNSLSLVFLIENEKILRIGEKMNELNEEAYMNGYNWEAFFNYYLPKHAPEILRGMEPDSEAGTYLVFYKLNSKNEKKAEKFASIIEDLIENENKLYKIIEDEGELIEWD